MTVLADGITKHAEHALYIWIHLTTFSTSCEQTERVCLHLQCFNALFPLQLHVLCVSNRRPSSSADMQSCSCDPDHKPHAFRLLVLRR